MSSQEPDNDATLDSTLARKRNNSEVTEYPRRRATIAVCWMPLPFYNLEQVPPWY